MNGISHTVDLTDATPTEEQIAIYAVLIRSLRDLAYEHILFEFRKCDGTACGLQFFQLCRDGKGIHAEIRTDEPDFTMYSRTMNDDEAVTLLREMIETRKTPDISDWENITEAVKKGRAYD